jgi:GNAT superfamily N-acetyltransferase
MAGVYSACRNFGRMLCRRTERKSYRLRRIQLQFYYSGFIEMLYTHFDYRRSGAGAALVRKLPNEVKEHYQEFSKSMTIGSF